MDKIVYDRGKTGNPIYIDAEGRFLIKTELNTDASGLLLIKERIANPVHINRSFILQQSSGILFTPSINKKFVITDINLSAIFELANQTITIFDEDINMLDNNILITHIPGALSLVGELTRDINFKTPYISKLSNNRLMISTSSAVVFSVHIAGYEE